MVATQAPQTSEELQNDPKYKLGRLHGYEIGRGGKLIFVVRILCYATTIATILMFVFDWYDEAREFIHVFGVITAQGAGEAVEYAKEWYASQSAKHEWLPG